LQNIFYWTFVFRLLQFVFSFEGQRPSFRHIQKWGFRFSGMLGGVEQRRPQLHCGGSLKSRT
jgi:hypothetical protein